MELNCFFLVHRRDGWAFEAGRQPAPAGQMLVRLISLVFADRQVPDVKRISTLAETSYDAYFSLDIVV